MIHGRVRCARAATHRRPGTHSGHRAHRDVLHRVLVEAGSARNASSVMSSGAIGSSEACRRGRRGRAIRSPARVRARCRSCRARKAAGRPASRRRAACVSPAARLRSMPKRSASAHGVLSCVAASRSPAIARIAISTPSNAPGTRRPGEPLASSPRCASITSGRLSRSNSRRTRASTAGTTGVNEGDTVTASAKRCGTCATDSQPAMRPLSAVVFPFRFGNSTTRA